MVIYTPKDKPEDIDASRSVSIPGEWCVHYPPILSLPLNDTVKLSRLPREEYEDSESHSSRPHGTKSRIQCPWTSTRFATSFLPLSHSLDTRQLATQSGHQHTQIELLKKPSGSGSRSREGDSQSSQGRGLASILKSTFLEPPGPDSHRTVLMMETGLFKLLKPWGRRTFLSSCSQKGVACLSFCSSLSPCHLAVDAGAVVGKLPQSRVAIAQFSGWGTKKWVPGKWEVSGKLYPEAYNQSI